MLVMVVFFFFFFSIRRRHTICLSDWSSDVCSSDLRGLTGSSVITGRSCWCPRSRFRRAGQASSREQSSQLCAGGQIGRAACRGGVHHWVEIVSSVNNANTDIYVGAVIVLDVASNLF